MKTLKLSWNEVNQSTYSSFYSYMFFLIYTFSALSIRSTQPFSTLASTANPKSNFRDLPNRNQSSRTNSKDETLVHKRHPIVYTYRSIRFGHIQYGKESVKCISSPSVFATQICMATINYVCTITRPLMFCDMVNAANVHYLHISPNEV